MTPVQFTVTVHYKRKRNEPGLTRMASKRISLGEALNWVLDELPDDAFDIAHDGDKAILTIDWALVPDEIRYGGL